MELNALDLIVRFSERKCTLNKIALIVNVAQHATNEILRQFIGNN